MYASSCSDGEYDESCLDFSWLLLRMSFMRSLIARGNIFFEFVGIIIWATRVLYLTLFFQ